MVAIHREKVVISRYDGRLVTDGRLIEKDRAKVEGSLKRLMKLWRLPIGTVQLEDEHTILVDVKGPLTPRAIRCGAQHAGRGVPAYRGRTRRGRRDQFLSRML